jgi:large subunit ribosomal protein L21
MEAVIATGGKQYRVAEGQVISVEKLAGDAAPDRLKAARVSGQVVAQGRGRKISIVKFKRRKNYRRNRGHRQASTTVRILKIEV